jgi:hypothetical protein
VVASAVALVVVAVAGTPLVLFDYVRIGRNVMPCLHCGERRWLATCSMFLCMPHVAGFRGCRRLAEKVRVSYDNGRRESTLGLLCVTVRYVMARECGGLREGRIFFPTF